MPERICKECRWWLYENSGFGDCTMRNLLAQGDSRGCKDWEEKEGER